MSILTSNIVCDAIEGPSKGKRCIFPFIFYGKYYNRCTWNDAPTGQPWCSTKVNATGFHIEDAGNWGVCGTDCPAESKNTRSLK